MNICVFVRDKIQINIDFFRLHLAQLAKEANGAGEFEQCHVEWMQYHQQ